MEANKCYKSGGSFVCLFCQTKSWFTSIPLGTTCYPKSSFGRMIKYSDWLGNLFFCIWLLEYCLWNKRFSINLSIRPYLKKKLSKRYVEDIFLLLYKVKERTPVLKMSLYLSNLKAPIYTYIILEAIRNTTILCLCKRGSFQGEKINWVFETKKWLYRFYLH